MHWMRRSRSPRANPKELLAKARSVIVLGMDYYFPRPEDPQGLTGMVSRYAWGKDYHKRISKRLLRMCLQIRDHVPGFRFFYGVDSRPFIERAWAERAGMGFIGKNTMMIAPGDSSFFFLAMILSSLDLEGDAPIQKNHCGGRPDTEEFSEHAPENNFMFLTKSKN